jgi:hypothetical protein
VYVGGEGFGKPRARTAASKLKCQSAGYGQSRKPSRHQRLAPAEHPTDGAASRFDRLTILTAGNIRKYSISALAGRTCRGSTTVLSSSKSQL